MRPAAAAELAEARESQYNSIFVYRDPPRVSMIFGHNRRLYTESIANTEDELELPVAYTRYMTVALAYAPAARRLLEIGLGGGSTAWYLHQTFPELAITAVELDPAVADLAQKYFFVKPGPRLALAVQDGRMFLVRNSDEFDIVLIDAYRGPFVPFHLLTKEFFEKVKERLKPGGVVAQNVEPTTMLYPAAVATIASVFENVEAYAADFNYVLVAYDGPARSAEELAAAAATLDAAHAPRYPLADLIRARQPAKAEGGEVLTDDFAPVEMLNATTRHNQKLGE
jgi:spermidine synthase